MVEGRAVVWSRSRPVASRFPSLSRRTPSSIRCASGAAASADPSFGASARMGDRLMLKSPIKASIERLACRALRATSVMPFLLLSNSSSVTIGRKMSCSSKRNNEVGSCISTLVSSTKRRGRRVLPPGSSDVARTRPERDLVCASCDTVGLAATASRAVSAPAFALTSAGFPTTVPTPLPAPLLLPRRDFTGAVAAPAGSFNNAAREPDRPELIDAVGPVAGLSFESTALARTGSSKSG